MHLDRLRKWVALKCCAAAEISCSFIWSEDWITSTLTFKVNYSLITWMKSDETCGFHTWTLLKWHSTCCYGCIGLLCSSSLSEMTCWSFLCVSWPLYCFLRCPSHLSLHSHDRRSISDHRISVLCFSLSCLCTEAWMSVIKYITMIQSCTFLYMLGRLCSSLCHKCFLQLGGSAELLRWNRSGLLSGSKYCFNLVLAPWPWMVL